MDSANECFSGCARYHKAANMNGRAIPGAYHFCLYVCDKAEMYRLCALVEDKCLNHLKNILKKKKRSSINLGQIFYFSFSKETEASY
jgi:hypothetical protein